MVNHEQSVTPPRIRLWPYIPILIILGLAVYLLVPQITNWEDSWSIVRSMTWWALALAVVAQTCSYLGSGFMLHAIPDTHQQPLSTLKGALITLASASIGLVAGGWVGGAAATYGWVRREGHDGNTATLAGTLPTMLNNGLLAGAALIGILYLLLIHDLSQTQLVEFCLIFLGLGLMAFGLVAALRFPEAITGLAVGFARRWATLRHKPFEPEKTLVSITQLAHSGHSLHHGQWRGPVLGAIANIGFDILTLYFLFIAAGYNVNVGILFAGYGLPFILGKLAFLLPGGVGVIEGSMVALYDSLQVPDKVSVVVILGYRVFSFWLPTLLGFAAAAYLSRKSAATEVDQA